MNPYASQGDYRRLYSGPVRAPGWVVIPVVAAVIAAVVAFVTSFHLNGLMAFVVVVSAGVIIIVPALAARWEVAHVSRTGDTLSVTLLGLFGEGRSFRAPVSEFHNWTIGGLGRTEAINFHFRGQRYTMPFWQAGNLDFEGLAAMDAHLGTKLEERRSPYLRRMGH